MVISSFYSVFTTTRIQLYMKMLEGRAGLKIEHHFENDEFDYYVMKDNAGNSTDLIQFKNKEVKEGFYAIRINVNDFAEMVDALQKVGYVLKENEDEKYAFPYFTERNKAARNSLENSPPKRTNKSSKINSKDKVWQDSKP